MINKKLKVLMASAEIAPLAKTGGLADVVGSLPPALKKLGCDIRLIMPLYGCVNKRKFGLKKVKAGIKIFSNKRAVKVNLWETKLPGTAVKLYLIEQNKYFGRPKIYWGNDSERFLFFSLAVLHILPLIRFKPDIIHCHDFHTALIPDLLKARAKTLPCFFANGKLMSAFYREVKTVFTIHNLNYQGNTETGVLSTGNLSKDALKSLSRDARDGDINFMLQGILNADLVNTVSRTYASEIATVAYGAGLEEVIKKRKKDLYGIVNGIDMNFFNPATDKNIKVNYSVKTLSKKALNKTVLQKKLGLPADKEIALVGFISRLVWQKGIELITERFSKLNCQFVFLGTGQKKYEKKLKELNRKYPDKFSVQIMFDIKLAQQIYAASDIFLMPSRFEPCGLGQMIAMRYGAAPVARATGGLDDTIDEKTGFKFKDFKTMALQKTLSQALDVYYKSPKKWRRLQVNGMKKDFSWNRSAKEYMKLYRKVLNKTRHT